MQTIIKKHRNHYKAVSNVVFVEIADAQSNDVGLQMSELRHARVVII